MQVTRHNIMSYKLDILSCELNMWSCKLNISSRKLNISIYELNTCISSSELTTHRDMNSIYRVLNSQLSSQLDISNCKLYISTF